MALELARLSRKVAEKIPRGDRSIADHLLRAASNTVMLLAEGANRRGAGQKRQRFVESRGERAEVAAAVDLHMIDHVTTDANGVANGLVLRDPYDQYRTISDFTRLYFCIGRAKPLTF